MHAPNSRPDPAALLAWYDRHRRVLPWRALPDATVDPYRVWLSEVMLQQTTVRAVIPYFDSFLQLWPTVEALAAAPDEDVMRAWAGLGYYSRARKLIACAREVVAHHGGRFPDDETALLALPGIGPYTAAAIAAIAFDRRATIVDGNVERVVARLFTVEAPLPGAKAEIRRLADMLTPATRPGDYAQAIMDLGATICTPRKPACGVCPWSAPCRTRGRSDIESFPRKSEKAARPLRHGLGFVLLRDGREILLRRRAAKGLLGGMTEVPGSVWSVTPDREAALGEAPLPSITWRPLPGVATHGFTHFELEVEVLVGAVPAGTPAPDGAWWHPVDALSSAGLPTVMRKIAAHAGLDRRPVPRKRGSA
jgi:A/G-specific adenine glycosylase